MEEVTATFANPNDLESIASAGNYAGANIFGIAASTNVVEAEVQSVNMVCGNENWHCSALRMNPKSAPSRKKPPLQNFRAYGS